MKILLGCIVLFLPFLVGSVFRSRSLSFTYLSGQLLMWAAFQAVAVPAVNLRFSFNALFWTYTILMTVLTVAGLRIRLKLKFEKPEISVFHAIALLIIAYQCGIYIIGKHIDQDDARWIAEANDALVKNKMLLYNPATGGYIGRLAGEMTKDAFSPWGMYLAWLSRATGINAAVMAHTVYAPVLLALDYSAYNEIGKELFKGRDERGIFLLMVSVIHLFMAGNVYMQTVFSLTRIWQGKGVVAAVVIPVILMCILRIQGTGSEGSAAGDNTDNWIGLVVAGFASCLFSGMGIAIGLIMIGIYGAYVVVSGLIRKKIGWTRVVFWLLSLAPGIAYGLGYMWLRG